MAYIRKFKTTSGATGVQVCWKDGKTVFKTVHVGSSPTEEGVKLLEKKARRIIDGEKGAPLFDLSRFDKK